MEKTKSLCSKPDTTQSDIDTIEYNVTKICLADFFDKSNGRKPCRDEPSSCL